MSFDSYAFHDHAVLDTDNIIFTTCGNELCLSKIKSHLVQGP